MRKFHLTVKNYRCFEDANPLRLTIQDGFIALVGPNNSGKSSCIKIFYEFRKIWEAIANSIKTLISLNTESYRQGLTFYGVYDQNEIYSDANERDLYLEIVLDNSLLGDDANKLSKIEFFCNRKAWYVDLFIGQKHDKLPKTNVVKEDSTKLGVKGTNLSIDCSEFMTLFRDLASCIYIGPFRNAISEGAGSYFDLSIGTDFITQWNHWKTGPAKRENLLIERITEDIRNIFEFENLEINSSMELKTLQFIVNNKPYKLKELGAGISQFVIVLGNIAIKKPAYLLIDEPESNLHPSLQLDFLTTIASYTRNSVIYASHSIGLARSSGDLLYSFTRNSGKITVKPLEKQNNYSEYLGEMSFSSYREMGFDSILCVEGVTDIKTVQQFLRKLRKDHKVVILPLGGDQLIAGDREQELDELKRLSNDLYVLIDSERTSAEEKLPQARQEFINICEKLGFKCCATNYRAIENYFSESAIKSVMGANYRALTPYEKLSDCEKPWGKTDNWRIARAMELSDIEETDVGKFLCSI